MNKLELVAKLADNTYNPVSKSGTFSLKPVVQGNKLTLKFSTIVHFASETSLRPQMGAAREHALQLIKSFLDGLKKSYKEETDEVLKMSDLKSDDNIEIIQATSNSLRKIAYFRFNQTLNID